VNLRPRILLPISLLVLSAVSLLAQSGSITGTVTDPSGAVVPGATVTAESSTTKQTFVAKTGNEGIYTISNVVPAHYTLTVTRDGFQPTILQNVTVTVAEVLPVNVKLQLGTTTTVVDVSGNTEAPIETETYQLSTIVDSKKMNDLPLILRDPYQLVLLSPGVVQGAGFGGPAVNGSRERNNNFLLDGQDNNDAGVPGSLGGVVGANPDSAAEFRVITNNFDAEYGRNTGAIINVVSKSGTNSLHGDAYEFGRYNALGARDWFNRKENFDGSTQPQNPYVRNDFGFSLGGPVMIPKLYDGRNKSFFFFNGEWQRFRTTLQDSITVPNAAFRSGNYTYIDSDGGLHPIDLTNPGNSNTGLPLDPTIQKLLTAYPLPQSPNPDGVSGTYFFPSASKQNSYSLLAKLDQKITNNEQLTVRYEYTSFSDPNSGHDESLPGGIGSTATVQANNSGTIQLTSTFTNNLINEANGGYYLLNAPFFCNDLSDYAQYSPTLDIYGNPSLYDVPTFGSLSCFNSSDAQKRLGSTGSFRDTLSFVHGRHTMKFGGELRHIREDGFTGFSDLQTLGFAPYSDFGFFNAYPEDPDFSNTADNTVLQNQVYFLQGVVDEQAQTQFYTKSGDRQQVDQRYYRQHEYGLFAQDSYKILPKLTISYGLRWEFNGVPYEEDANLSNLYEDASGTGPFTFTIVGPGTGKMLYANSWKLFEPRVGFAYDISGNGKMALRGGYGIFHDRIFGNLFGNARGNPPFEQAISNIPNLSSENWVTASNAGYIPTTGTSDVASVDNTFFTSPVLIDPNLKIPTSQNWNLGIQAEIFKDTVLEVNYVASHGTHILRERSTNAPDPSKVAALRSYCSNPENDYGCTPASVAGAGLWYGFEAGVLPFDATNNYIFGNTLYQEGTSSSSYNSLQAEVTKRYSHGFQLQGAYTWAHALDDSNDSIVPGNGARGLPRNSYNLQQEYGNASFDIRQRGVINGTWLLPIGTGSSFLNKGFIGKIFEGIQISGIQTLQTGYPFDIFGNRDNQGTGLSNRVSYSGSPWYPDGIKGAIDPLGAGKHFGPVKSAFVLPDYDTVPTVRRNQFFGPNLVTTDAVFQKNQKLYESLNLIFRLEAYNLANHPQFNVPDNTFADSTFGISTSTPTQGDGTTTARQLQVSLKLSF
jgi:hypothetical protein